MRSRAFSRPLSAGRAAIRDGGRCCGRRAARRFVAHDQHFLRTDGEHLVGQRLGDVGGAADHKPAAVPDCVKVALILRLVEIGACRQRVLGLAKAVRRGRLPRCWAALSAPLRQRIPGVAFVNSGRCCRLRILASGYTVNQVSLRTDGDTHDRPSDVADARTGGALPPGGRGCGTQAGRWPISMMRTTRRWWSTACRSQRRRAGLAVRLWLADLEAGNRAFEERLALARGWHRSFCIKMTRWRGTLERPGLMIGPRPGGQCQRRCLTPARTVIARTLRKTVPARNDRQAVDLQAAMDEAGDGRRVGDGARLRCQPGGRTYAGKLSRGGGSRACRRLRPSGAPAGLSLQHRQPISRRAAFTTAICGGFRNWSRHEIQAGNSAIATISPEAPGIGLPASSDSRL